MSLSLVEALHTEALVEKVKQRGAHIGIAVNDLDAAQTILRRAARKLCATRMRATYNTGMKLPKLERPDRYQGLYVFDFGDHAGVGFTAEEVAELLDSEKVATERVDSALAWLATAELILRLAPASTRL